MRASCATREALKQVKISHLAKHLSGGQRVTNTTGIEQLGCKELVLRGQVLPWIFTIVAALASQRLAWLLYDLGVLRLQFTWDIVLFCGVIAGGVTPRAIPRAVQLKVTDGGMTVRDVFFFANVKWHEVDGPFEVRKTWLGEAIYFKGRIRTYNRTMPMDIGFQNNFGVPTRVLVDTLNFRRGRSIGGAPCPSG